MSVKCGKGYKYDCIYRDWSGASDGATDAELVNATGMAQWAEAAAAEIAEDCPASPPGASIRLLPVRDEPFWSWRAAPVATSAVVAARFRGFLEAHNMSPSLLGSSR